MRPRALLAGLLLAILVTPAWAHGIFLELREAKPGQVVGEVYFSDGSPPGEGTWQAFRAGAEQPFARGELLPGGLVRFSVDAPGPVRVVVEEPGLHRCEARLEVAGAAPAAPVGSADPPAPGPAPPAAPSPVRRGGVPWSRLLFGLGVIAALGGGMTLWQRRAAPPTQ